MKDERRGIRGGKGRGRGTEKRVPWNKRGGSEQLRGGEQSRVGGDRFKRRSAVGADRNEDRWVWGEVSEARASQRRRYRGWPPPIRPSAAMLLVYLGRSAMVSVFLRSPSFSSARSLTLLLLRNQRRVLVFLSFLFFSFFLSFFLHSFCFIFLPSPRSLYLVRVPCSSRSRSRYTSRSHASL